MVVALSCIFIYVLIKCAKILREVLEVLVDISVSIVDLYSGSEQAGCQIGTKYFVFAALWMSMGPFHNVLLEIIYILLIVKKHKL